MKRFAALRASRRRVFQAGVIAAVLVAVPGLSAHDAEYYMPAVSPEDFQRRHAELTARTAEIQKEVAALNRELSARRREIGMTIEIQPLLKQAVEAKAGVEGALATDPKLVELRQARDRAKDEVDAARRAMLDASDEAQALFRQKTDAEIQDARLAFKVREVDFVIERRVLPRLQRDHADLAAAQKKQDDLARQMTQARTAAESGSQELTASRAELDQARAGFDATRTAELDALHKARAEQEGVLRAITAETLKDADKAVTDAQQNAATIRADRTARDEEFAALTNRLADLKGRLAALKGQRATIDKARTEMLADSDRRIAEIEFEAALTDFRLREDIGRRIGLMPDVRKADAAVADAENVRRALRGTALPIARVRVALDALRRRIGELESPANDTPERAEVRAACAKREQALNELREQRRSDAVAGLTAAYDEAARALEALRAQKLAGDEEAQELVRAKEEATRERAAVGARRQEIEAQLSKLVEKTAASPALASVNAAASAAARAYDIAYAAPEIQNLIAAERKASEALSARTSELQKADATCSAITARIAANLRQESALRSEIQSLGR